MTAKNAPGKSFRKGISLIVRWTPLLRQHEG